MAMEELDEFKVLWPEICHTHGPPPPSSSPAQVRAAQPSDDAPEARSRPVDVPATPNAARSWHWNRPRDDDSGDHGDDPSAIVPPHLLLSGSGWRGSEAAEPAPWTLRASAGGPPCKRARDLRLLRDSVLRMTGFIEG